MVYNPAEFAGAHYWPHYHHWALRTVRSEPAFSSRLSESTSGIFSSVTSEVPCARSHECNFISLMDFDARDYPLFFACRSTENWIIYGFEVMKGNLTYGGGSAHARRSDNFKNRVDSARTRKNREKKEERRRWENTANGGNNDGIRTIQEQRNYSITIDADYEFSWHGVL